MKKIITSLALLLPITAYADDPFSRNSWFNGSNSVATSQHAVVPGGYDHSLTFTLPDGFMSSTDACTASGNTLNCATGDKLTVIPNQFAVTLTTQSSSYRYYQKGHEPKSSPMSGDWHCAPGPGGFVAYDHIIVPYIDNNETSRFDNIKVTEKNGGFHYTNYVLDQNETAGQWHLFFGSKYSYSEKYYLFDANGKQIDDINQLNTVVKLVNIEYSDSCTKN